MWRTLIYGGIEYKSFLINENGDIKNTKTNHTYKVYIGKHGYKVVTLPMGHRGKVKLVKQHKALAEVFIENPFNYPIVLHKDENKLNNSLSNLEWGTHKKNTNDHWKFISKTTPYFNNRKLTKDQADDIRQKHKEGYSNRRLAFMYGVSAPCIISIIKEKSYRY